MYMLPIVLAVVTLSAAVMVWLHRLRRPRLLHCRRCLVFDTETDELPRCDEVKPHNVDLWPRIISINWLIVNNNGDELSRRSFDLLQDDMADVLQCFRQDLMTCDCIVGHNLAHNMNMIEVESMRIGAPIEWPCVPRVCTMRESTEWCHIPHALYIYKWPRLEELYGKLFNTTPPMSACPSVRRAEIIARCFVALRQRGVIR